MAIFLSLDKTENSKKMTCDFRSRSPGLFDDIHDVFLLFKNAFSQLSLSLVSVSRVSSK